ncbi:fumarylacetoacetate hydrolase family protein [Conexibacter sp. DBS9H8]|uniref:fumarylacetoacetate hydrolase family protein n=1 Tax=Conexibacter sp. DBS9H8 TaxID=2937801 RepID=UPI00200DBD2A|nr:fumarylacetoacetate hydrolase family protein [Conexibacter sp. DBS9H8]
MRLATFTAEGSRHAGLVLGEEVHAITAPVKEVLAGRAQAVRTGAHWPLHRVRLEPPIPDPGTVYAIGRNYAAHIEELSHERPDQPIVFLKPAGAINAPGGPVRRPAVVRQLDYEAELVAVIGAAGAVAGFCVANDVSARDLQTEPQWTRAKGADTFCPFGPWITTADEVPDPQSLWIRSWVNGELRQDAHTSLLLFGLDVLVAFITETHALRPGDMILTGTPAGVGAGMDPPRWLEPGDRVRIEIEGLGAIEHPIL